MCPLCARCAPAVQSLAPCVPCVPPVSRPHAPLIPPVCLVCGQVQQRIAQLEGVELRELDSLRAEVEKLQAEKELAAVELGDVHQLRAELRLMQMQYEAANSSRTVVEELGIKHALLEREAVELRRQIRDQAAKEDGLRQDFARRLKQQHEESQSKQQHSVKEFSRLQNRISELEVENSKWRMERGLREEYSTMVSSLQVRGEEADGSFWSGSEG